MTLTPLLFSTTINNSNLFNLSTEIQNNNDNDNDNVNDNVNNLLEKKNDSFITYYKNVSSFFFL